MIVDLSGVLKETGNKIVLSGKLDLDDVRYLGEEFRFISSITANLLFLKERLICVWA